MTKTHSRLRAVLGECLHEYIFFVTHLNSFYCKINKSPPDRIQEGILKVIKDLQLLVI